MGLKFSPPSPPVPAFRMSSPSSRGALVLYGFNSNLSLRGFDQGGLEIENMPPFSEGIAYQNPLGLEPFLIKFAHTPFSFSLHTYPHINNI